MSTPHKEKSEEQLHYESLISFLKWTVGITGGLIVAIAAVALSLSFSDRNQMREDYEKTIDRLQTQVTKASEQAIESQKSISESAKQQIELLQRSSVIRLNEINSETKKLALNKTQQNIDSIFKTNKIEQVIDNQATTEIKKKVNEIVDAQTKNILLINDAAAGMREGNRSAMLRLREYFLNSKNPQDSQRAKKLYNQVRNDYTSFYESMYDGKGDLEADIRNLTIYNHLLNTDDPSFGGIKILNNKVPNTKREREDLSALIEYINHGNDLKISAMITMLLSRISGVNFEFFNESEINKWYYELSK